jgi:hypothetical protein
MQTVPTGYNQLYRCPGDGGVIPCMQRYYCRLFYYLLLKPLHVSVVRPSSSRNIFARIIFLLEDRDISCKQCPQVITSFTDVRVMGGLFRLRNVTSVGFFTIYYLNCYMFRSYEHLQVEIYLLGLYFCLNMVV